ncbi:HDIG domain-containing protein [Romboutsia maritimum]|uniref:HDIG domain-containing protein n=1 Tax=Romboutsia maritimum TaxID=2020948 RepID=A0A371IUT7_9FIRM|nr:HDIG domain-containing metalloprotein [Romboutsia maritimum]RDY24243.1 HDIG domain-containing protein [Romboutsia maritimum]
MTYKAIYKEIDEILLKMDKPSEGIKRLIKEGKFDKQPFDIIKKLDNIDQNIKYHPEGSVLNHILLVIDEASKNKEYSSDKRVFMWAALLHDIGKLTTTRIRKNRITSYNHDVEGKKIALEFLNQLSDDKIFNKKVSDLVKYHMQPLFFDKNLPFFDLKNMLKEVDFKEVANLSLCDRLGRGNMTKEDIKNEKERIERFVSYCTDVK